MTLVMQEEIVDAEIVPSKIDALASIERAIEHVDGFWAEVRWQVENEVWSLLGYADFDALWDDRYAGVNVGVLRAERPETVRVLRSAGQTQQQVADKLGVGVATIKREDASLKVSNDTFTGAAVTNSRGQSRPATYKKREQPEPDKPLNVDKTTGEIKENDVEVTDYHHTPYAEGYVLFSDRDRKTVSVGKDGRAHSRGMMQKAIDWARANPSEKTYDAAKASGLSLSYINGAYAALRKNREIHAVSGTGRRPHEEFGVLATGVKHLGMSVEKFLTEGTIDFIEPDEIDYYMDGLKEGMAQLVKFQRAARALHKSGQQ